MVPGELFFAGAEAWILLVGKTRTLEAKEAKDLSLLRKYFSAYMKGKAPEVYTKDSKVTVTDRYWGKRYEVPLPDYDDLEAAVQAAEKAKR